MDETSLPFDGFNIDVRSAFVQKGSVKSKSISRFTSDVDFIQVQPSSIDNEGFVVLACIQDIDDNWYVPFVEIDADGEEYKVQNGNLAFTYLHPKFHVHNMPAEDVTVNKADDTATTVVKFKKQELTFPFPNGLNPMELVQTNIGLGSIKSVSVNLISQSAKAQIYYNE